MAMNMLEDLPPYPKELNGQERDYLLLQGDIPHIEDEISLDDDGDILDIIRFGFPRHYYERTDFFNEMDNLSFFRRFRLQKNTVLRLVEQLKHQLEFDNSLYNSMSPINQLLTCLRFYACNAY
ncbi:unnamed protein product [Acanthoscelides obtectus]|uniref:Uncharacterized protein n=1 Tax=Acanthoscelides obtectus TaxID=200917 RepID=A0A9P0NU85_ACAOB|nr:unnamed protein product [Acanthoscelides obtectus]CAK1639736.1 hypothetical protein AOBTE_LOCUS11342 [Acanthoscelides obtectus]